MSSTECTFESATLSTDAEATALVDDAALQHRGSQSVRVELEQVKALFPPRMIEACNLNFVQVIVMRTPFARIQARLQFPDEYPATPLIVELTSASLPPPFLRKLTKRAEAEAQHWCQAAPDVKPAGARKVLGRAVAALTVVQDAVHKNKFLPCWKELRQAAALVTSRGGELRAEETTGLISIRIKSGKYSVLAAVQVPDGYPMEGCGVEIRSHNFPAAIARRHVLQAEEIVRRCLCGYPPALALQTSNPIKIASKKGAGAAQGERVRITSEHVRNLKHDVDFLKKAHDLRDLIEAKSKGNAKVAAASTQERRAARRELKTLAKAEAANDEEELRKMAELELREQDERLHAQLADTSQPSLLPLVDFLVNVFGWRLPQETCISCNRKVLPTDPKDASLTDAHHKDRPTRVFCGHWFHYDCIRTWMTEPPFGKECPRCRRQIYHPDWPQGPKQLEKVWAQRQAKRREIGEVRDFFTVDAQFQTESNRSDDFSAFT